MIISILKFGILLGILLYASIKDIKYREVPDSVHLMIIILGLCGKESEDLPLMLFSMLFVFLPQYLVSMIFPTHMIGGADIKFSCAIAFYLGLPKGIYAFILGLLLAVIIVPIIRRCKKRSEPSAFPLLPFLSVGVLATYFI